MESITKIDLTVDMVRTDLWWSNGTTGVSHALTKTSVGGHVRSRARPRQLRNSPFEEATICLLASYFSPPLNPFPFMD